MILELTLYFADTRLRERPEATYNVEVTGSG